MSKYRLILAAIGLGLPGCGVDLEFGAASHIDHTRVLGIHARVVELAPIWPERFGFDPDQAAITEALPGDRVRLEPLLIAGDGQVLAVEGFDALWFQCAQWWTCTPELPPCAELDWTTDVSCELGRGGGFEFEFPPLGPVALDDGLVTYMGLVALAEDTDIEDCRRAWIDGSTELRRCTIVISEFGIGPRWPLLYEAAQLGLEIEVPLFEIPAAAFFQPANRAPSPDPPEFVDAETKARLVGDPPQVRAGQGLASKGPRWREADEQVWFRAKPTQSEGVFVFVPDREQVGVEWFVSGPLTVIETKGDSVLIQVDEFAEPGPARVVTLIGDDRLSLDVRSMALEVVP